MQGHWSRHALLAIAASGTIGTALANPTGPVTVSGTTLISNPFSNVLQVVNTPGAIINWNGFSIANGETTRFVQDSANSAVLNRVVGAARSDILGRLESNGRVFLINPNGIVFGGSSVVDVAGLIASTRDISNANFLAGNYLFDGAGSGTITMQNGARITTATYAPSGGQVWLFAKDVTPEKDSSIAAPQGQVVLAAGTKVQVGSSGLGNMSFTVTTDGSNSLESMGTIAASQGAVGLFADYINHTGTIDAVNGTVGFNQSEPSQYTVAPAQTIFPSSDTTTRFTGEDVGPLVIYRRADGSYALRDVTAPCCPSGSNTFTIWETILDASGRVTSGPTQLRAVPQVGSIPNATTYAEVVRDVPAGYWDASRGAISGLASNMSMADGNKVKLAFISGEGTKALFTASNGSAVGETPIVGFTGFAVPTTDGRVAVGSPGGGAPLAFYRADGSKVNEQAATGLTGPGYPTPDGGITILKRTSAGVVSEHWTKLVHPLTPGTPPASGDVGVASQFAVRPGVAPVDLYAPAPTPPPPPPVSQGSGGGAMFDGVAGCNSAVCSEEVRAAIAASVQAKKVAENQSNRISEVQAADAVKNIAKATGRTMTEDQAQAAGVTVVASNRLTGIFSDPKFLALRPEEQAKVLEREIEKEVLRQKDPDIDPDTMSDAEIARTVVVNVLSQRTATTVPQNLTLAQAETLLRRELSNVLGRTVSNQEYNEWLKSEGLTSLLPPPKPNEFSVLRVFTEIGDAARAALARVFSSDTGSP